MRTILVVLILSGCATQRLVAIDYNRAPPVDWPKLDERVTYIAKDDLPRFCQRVQESGKIISCATVSFNYGLCQIYLATDDLAALEHERAHCKGYGHVGDTVNYQARAWDAFKASRR